MNYRVKGLSKTLLLVVFSLALAACSRGGDKDKKTTSPEKSDVSSTQTNKVAKKTPPSLPPQPPPKILPVSGKVLEILDTGGFLFVALDWQGKKVWATVPGVDLKVGEVISLDHATMIKDFHSKALNRTFDELIFASSIGGKSPRPMAANGAKSKGSSGKRAAENMGGLSPMAMPSTPVPGKPVPKPGPVAGH